MLEYFTSVPEDSRPLRRCIDNPDLIDVIKSMDNQDASFLWLGILWLKYQELIPEVRVQLENITRDLGKGSRRTDLEKYLATMDSELKATEEALTEYNTWSTDPNTVALRNKIDGLQAARSTLVSLRPG